MSVNFYGRYAGIPVYVDPDMDEDRILVMKETGVKPSRDSRVPNPRIKGLVLDLVTAYIVHPSIADNLEKVIMRNNDKT